jgi:hypothetical protein
MVQHVEIDGQCHALPVASNEGSERAHLKLKEGATTYETCFVISRSKNPSASLFADGLEYMPASPRKAQELSCAVHAI